MDPGYFCRVHGEMLVPDLPRLGWSCPEISVCGTWVGHERFFLTARDYAQVQASLAEEPRVIPQALEALLRTRQRLAKG